MANKSMNKISVTTTDEGMKQVKSCGVLVFRDKFGKREFLLMKHSNRYDLPKGHQEHNETEKQTALRELQEETKIPSSSVRIVDDFTFVETYYPKYKRFGGETVEKTLVIFLGVLQHDMQISPSEHPGYEWIEWKPPHKIQKNTIDSLLAKVEQFGKF